MNLERIENEVNHIEAVRTQMLEPIKLQLHSGMEGFDSPDAYGVYRKSGGQPLGVVGKVFKPIDLNVLLDSIVASAQECCIEDIDLSKLEYNEYKGGSKVTFSLPLIQKREIKGSPMVGDLVSSSLLITTGFDGLTKTSVSFIANRLWCTNGASRKSAIDVSFKNTFNNHAKLIYLCNELMTCINDVEEYITQLGDMVKKQVKQKDIDAYLTKVTGYNVKEYSELNTRKRNILDKINQSVAIEMNNTGANLFSLYNGITRYTTHDMAKGDVGELMFSSANKMNADALTSALVLMN